MQDKLRTRQEVFLFSECFFDYTMNVRKKQIIYVCLRQFVRFGPL